eukprot:524307-Hanusia_phi.AAC.1
MPLENLQLERAGEPHSNELGLHRYSLVPSPGAWPSASPIRVARHHQRNDDTNHQCHAGDIPAVDRMVVDVLYLLEV